jgi:hypothetical protein
MGWISGLRPSNAGKSAPRRFRQMNCHIGVLVPKVKRAHSANRDKDLRLPLTVSWGTHDRIEMEGWRATNFRHAEILLRVTTI